MSLLLTNRLPILFLLFGILASCADSATFQVYGATTSKTSSSNLYVVELSGDAQSHTVIGPIVGEDGDGLYLNALAYDRTTGILYGHTSPSLDSSTGKSLYTINVDTVVATLVNPVTMLETFAIGMSFDSTGQLYAWDRSGADAYLIDKSTAVASKLGESGLGPGGGSGLAFDTRSDTLHFVESGGRVHYVVDTTTGQAFLQGNIVKTGSVSHGDIAPDTGLWYASAQATADMGAIEIIDLTTRNTTNIVVTGIPNLFLLAFGPEIVQPTVSPIPTASPSASPTIDLVCDEEEPGLDTCGSEDDDLYTVHRRFLFGTLCRSRCVTNEEARRFTSRFLLRYTCGPC